jgi:uncharacterized protein (DUF58 family)
MTAGLRALPRLVLAFAEHRLPALTRLRRAEPLPIHLGRQRIYVLPTGFGVFFAVLLGAMTLGALNYDNNPALILCFLLGSVALTALLYAYLTLRGLRLLEVSGEAVHAGQPLTLKLRFDALEPRRRRGIELERGGQRSAFDLEPGHHADVELPIATERRGWLAVGRIKLAVRQPLGLTVAWSWLHPRLQLLVYPALEANPPPLPGDGGEGLPQRRRGPDEQLHDLRDFRSGDPMRMVAWKRSAQLGRLTVREVESPRGHDAVLDWNTLPGLAPEARIRRLARWLVDAERAGLRSELRLPGSRLGPARGPAHLHACLRCLALLEVEGGATVAGQ